MTTISKDKRVAIMDYDVLIELIRVLIDCGGQAYTHEHGSIDGGLEMRLDRVVRSIHIMDGDEYLKAMAQAKRS